MFKQILVILSLIFFTFAQQKAYEGPVIGIDLGTTFSVVGIYRNGKVEIIPNEQGNRITPSVVSFTPSGGVLVGEAAKNNIQFNPQNTLYDVKRLIGRKLSEVQKVDKDLFTFTLTGENEKLFIKAEVGNETKTFSPEQVSAMVLGKMKKIAENYLNEPVKYAVVTVPAYFNDAQRQATKDAGVIAGLEIIRIINEPTAASMAYGLYKKAEQDILVYDLGGGTLDVSLLTIDNGTFQVRATAGDMHLGGEDFDQKLVDYFTKVFQQKHKKDIKGNKRAFQKLKMACEKAKRILSNELETDVEIESLLDGIDFKERLTRAKFEELNKEGFINSIKPIKQVLSDAKIGIDEVDVVVLVGGSTRIPKVQQLVSEFFKGKKLEKEEVNPDEAIAYGAAVQAAIINGDESLKDVVIMDVTPLSLGIETQGGIMAKIIHRNTPIPTEKYDIFTTTEDYQTQLAIPIYEGERSMTRFNRLLGELQLTDIPSARKGYPQIKVLFKLDKNGILQVSAQDMQTKKVKEITIKKGFLSADEVEKMTKDAEQNAKEDEEFRRAAEARMRLENYCDTVRNQMTNKAISNRIKATDRKTINKAISRTLQWLGQQNEPVKKEIYKKLVSLKRVVQPILSKVTGVKMEEGLYDDKEEEEAASEPEEETPVSEEEKKDDIAVEETPKEAPKTKKDEL
jgi:endoplasmic reticulum chaperone BiP